MKINRYIHTIQLSKCHYSLFCQIITLIILIPKINYTMANTQQFTKRTLHYCLTLFLIMGLSLFEASGTTFTNNQNTQAEKGRTIKGRIIDDSQQGLPGANVVVKGTKIGTITDIDGNFSIQTSLSNPVLTVTFMGYITQEIVVKGTSDINIQMSENSKLMDEVVVVGYGTQKKINLTGAVAAISIDEKIAGRSLTNVSSGLSALIPGLAVNQNSGMAGKNSASLMIRGLGSVNNASPLIVVDGMPDVNIDRLNMNDIESISVLKDATSAAIYGSRASNGVVLVTTKSGKSQGKTKINFSSSYAITQPTNFYKFLVDYPRSMTLSMRSNAAGGLPQDYRDGAIEQWMALSKIDPISYPNTDWWSLIMRNGTVKNNNISASGGNEKTNFYISVGVMNELGLQVDNDYSRYNARFNFDYKILDNLTAGARFDGNWSDMSFPLGDGFVDSSSNAFDIVSAVAGVYPQDPITGNWGGAMAYGESSFAFNPVAIYASNNNENSRQEANGNMFLDWEIIKGLKARIDYSLSYHNQFSRSWQNPHSVYNLQDGSIVRQVIADNAGISNSISTNYKTQLNGRLSYEKKIAKHHEIAALFVYSEEYWYGRSLSASRLSRIYPTLTEIDAALPDFPTANGNSSAEGLLSYIGRINYAAYDKYLLEINCRYDGSSKFLPGHQFGFFPSAAIGWRFSQEAFLLPVTKSLAMSNGKFRISYGGLGNNSGVDRYAQKETMTLTNYVIGGKVAQGFVMKDLINPDFSWEKTNVMNLGLDLGFFNQRLTAEIDYYDRLTTGMIRPSDLSTLLSGYIAPRQNIGNLRNRGVEGNFTWRDKISDFSYQINFNAAYNQNRLEEWNEYLSKGYVFLDMPYHFLYRYQSIGLAQSWNDIYNAPYQGQNFAPGDVLKADLNGDGQINGEDRIADPKVQRNRPTTNLGLNMSASWKGFDLSLVFQGATGRKDYWLEIWNSITPNTTRSAFTETQWNDSWSLENRSAILPRLVSQGGARGNSSDETNYWLQDMSYLRLKNLQVGYNLPKNIIKKVGIDNLRIYLSGENIFTLTNYKGIDPERAGNINNIYPLTKSYSLGINIGI